MRLRGLVLVLLGFLGMALPAGAAPDLASITLDVQTIRVGNVVKGVTASVEVTGDRIVRAAITPPGGTLVEIPVGGAGFFLEKKFTSEAEVAAAFPDGTYVLTLNGSTNVAFDFARAPVPSPAISAPLGAEILLPGPVTVEFTRCSICDQDFDSTAGALLDGAALVIASDDTLAPDGWRTTLLAPMTASTSGAVEVNDARRFPLAHSFEVLIGSERLNVSRLDDQNISVIDRAVGGTTAAAHAVNDTVSEVGQTDTSWTPAIELDADGSFTAIIVHTAVRGVDLVGPGNDAFTLAASFSQQDSVVFFTGAASPAGSFCIAVADDDGVLDPLGECLAIDEPSAALIDPSGTFALSAGGVNMEYDAEVSAGGALTGSARADLDGNGSLETTTPLRGRLQGFMGKVHRSVSFDFRSMAPAAKLAVRIREQASVEDGAIDGVQRAKGTVLGMKVREDAPSTLPLGDEPLAWRLKVELNGKHVEKASVKLSDGRIFALRGRFLFDFLTDLGKLDLRSEGADEGVRVRIEDFRADDLESQPPVFDSGDFTFKILGQRGRINPLP